jgi:Domain of unknown function (DUF4386)
MDTRKIATLTGWLMVVTFVTSIPAYFILYAPVRNNPDLITGAGVDPTASVALGAVLELILIIANVGTAVAPYAVFKRYSEGLALGYVAARLVEATFIAIGIISLLTFLFMRQQGTARTDAALGEAFVAIYDRAFLIGPGFFAGSCSAWVTGRRRSPAVIHYCFDHGVRPGSRTRRRRVVAGGQGRRDRGAGGAGERA